MGYSCWTLREKMLMRKVSGKERICLNLFSLLPVHNLSCLKLKFILGCHNLSCYLRELYLFLDSALFHAELNLLCYINISLTIP